METAKKTPGVEVILLDAMYTIFEAKGGRKGLLAKVFSDALKKPISANRLWKVHQDVRREMPASADFRGNWTRWNIEILRRYGVEDNENSRKLMDHIHHRILGDVSLYEVRPDMRELVEWLCIQSGLKVVIATNQHDHWLKQLMQSFNWMEQYFPDELVLTSDSLSTPTETVAKPSLDYYRRVLERLGVQDPASVIMVGNSHRNDAPAAKLGIRVILFDRTQRKPKRRHVITNGREYEYLVCNSPEVIRGQILAAK